ncbi:Gp15 family bacteriophage protein [Virgibacillus sp. Bac332]|uniref:Gp15 family bacteriophage protein n=1 Tax=Virgibacillus sp. Bac332 TaxID=2419842 RepID=UPI000EF48B0F|nr:Gp15 family bacteriophage protein [Virgibacillus sp. Bac332]
MFLNERLSDELIFRGVTYYINMDFSNILRLFEMLDDKEIDEFGKVVIGLQLLIDYYSIDDEKKEFTKEIVNSLDYFEQYDLLMAILKEKLDFDIPDQENLDQSKGSRNKKKEFDFMVDGELIYASFLMDYDIDLIEQQGQLHWKKFLALFQGLSEQTPFMKVVHIRTMDVPKPDKHNQKERKRIQDMKRKYALEQPDLDSGLDKAAAFLHRHAKVGGK